MLTKEEKLKLVVNSIKNYPDFPKPGILFRDIFGVLRNVEASAALFDLITEECENYRGTVTAVCGLDSRGFLFAPQIARQLNVPFLPIRKKGKLPGDVIEVEYSLEYNSDVLQISTESLTGDCILIVDDLLATGGSLCAAGELVKKLGCKSAKGFVIMELAALNGRSKVSYPVHSILKF